MTMAEMSVIGNLGTDPEMRYLPNGDPVTNFPVAVNYKYQKDGKSIEEVTWYRIAVFGRQAESCNQYLGKGSKVYVRGRLKADTYVDRNGDTRISLDINSFDVKFLSSARGDDNSGGGQDGGAGHFIPPAHQQEESNDAPPPGGPITAADLPF